jgi:hypothetical protein
VTLARRHREFYTKKDVYFDRENGRRITRLAVLTIDPEEE